jgi:hypothetical protein
MEKKLNTWRFFNTITLCIGTTIPFFLNLFCATVTVVFFTEDISILLKFFSFWETAPILKLISFLEKLSPEQIIFICFSFGEFVLGWVVLGLDAYYFKNKIKAWVYIIVLLGNLLALFLYPFVDRGYLLG